MNSNITHARRRTDNTDWLVVNDKAWVGTDDNLVDTLFAYMFSTVDKFNL